MIRVVYGVDAQVAHTLQSGLDLHLTSCKTQALSGRARRPPQTHGDGLLDQHSLRGSERQPGDFFPAEVQCGVDHHIPADHCTVRAEGEDPAEVAGEIIKIALFERQNVGQRRIRRGVINLQACLRIGGVRRKRWPNPEIALARDQGGRAVIELDASRPQIKNLQPGIDVCIEDHLAATTQHHPADFRVRAGIELEGINKRES